jgi:S-DNA-T family DNA segregation ATPase FtsK/SpoIIIE
MKPQRLVYSPTRSRRLNEMLGLIVLVAAGLLLLALVSYTPSDPSFNTVGGAVGAHPHNWTGLVGAYLSDLLLQSLGVAIVFVPLILIRIGISWMRSRPVGSTKAKSLGLVLWLVFAPAAIALLPGHLLWRHAVPICGLEGQMLADGLVHFVNFPGAVIVSALMVALSLYLATTFMLTTARQWFASHFSFIQAIANRYAMWKNRKNGVSEEAPDAYAARRIQRSEELSQEPNKNSLLRLLRLVQPPQAEERGGGRRTRAWHPRSLRRARLGLADHAAHHGRRVQPDAPCRSSGSRSSLRCAARSCRSAPARSAARP